jgi:hypothetical protein
VESLIALYALLLELRELSARWAVRSHSASVWLAADDAASDELRAVRGEIDELRQQRARARLH